MGIFTDFFKPTVNLTLLKKYVLNATPGDKPFEVDECIKALNQLAEDQKAQEENPDVAVLVKYCLMPKLEAYKVAEPSTPAKEAAAIDLLKALEESEKTLKTFLGYSTTESSVMRSWANLLRPKTQETNTPSRIIARKLGKIN